MAETQYRCALCDAGSMSLDFIKEHDCPVLAAMNARPIVVTFQPQPIEPEPPQP